MKRYQNLWLLLGVVVLMVLPLMVVDRPAPGPGQQEVEIFGGADDQAKEMVAQIRPDYQPWFQPILEPASGEIASLLFALQAALGAGFIGYYLGSAVTAAKVRQKS
ncbi:MAG: energy-coupling factor ABC transporter substrate-binding protein [Desulfobacca sp.]|uniref:energy-coupling factor ABC transporter substrate-binding protein n=1 Tax=Desulfobacca sp. TaxID=2067990 RepID=UPI00404B0390